MKTERDIYLSFVRTYPFDIIYQLVYTGVITTITLRKNDDMDNKKCDTNLMT